MKRILVNELQDYFAKQRNGKKLSRTTVWRWVTKGTHGVRLETWWDSGIHYTTPEALKIFNEAVTESMRAGSRALDPAPSLRAQKQAKSKLAKALA